MKDDLFIQHNITIPAHELEITASRSGGPGGQHVNKTSSRITVRWNVRETTCMPNYLKERVITNLAQQLHADGSITVHASSSRSQQQNKDEALAELARRIRKALHVPKKRIATTISEGTHEKRLQKKSARSSIKKLRRSKIDDE